MTITSRFNELLTYEDGRLYWAVNRRGGAKAGDRAGCAVNNGYRHVVVDGKGILEHRIIYEMHHGPIPKGMQIDHINHDKSDNRIENLRVVTASENARNNPNAKGYHFCNTKKRWIATIHDGEKQLRIGSFKTKELAREAYLDAKAKYHPSSPIGKRRPFDLRRSKEQNYA